MPAKQKTVQISFRLACDWLTARMTHKSKSGSMSDIGHSVSCYLHVLAG